MNAFAGLKGIENGEENGPRSISLIFKDLWVHQAAAGAQAQ